MISLFEKRPILTIIAVVGVLLIPLLNVVDVTIMEARNFITAREMLIDGNWILTTMNGEPRYEKPPLPTWITAISASIFGISNVWGLRLPAVIMVMLLGSMMYTISRKLHLSQRHGFINALVAITSLYVLLIVIEAPWDIYTHAFMICGIYFVLCGLKSERLHRTFTLGLGAVIGIAASILSKGPVSLYVLFVPFLFAYILIYRKETTNKQWRFVVMTIILALLLGFSWYIYVRYKDPTTFLKIASRETGNWSSYNIRPFYYYWSFFVQSGLWTIPAFISLLYPYMKSRVSHLTVYKFTLIWVIVAVLFLSIIPEKKSRYLMPVLIPLAFNIGFYVEYLLRCFKDIRDLRERLPVYFNFGIIAFIFCLGPMAIIIRTIKDVEMRILDLPLKVFFYVSILCIVGLWLFKALIKRRGYVLIILSITGMIFTMHFYGVLQNVLPTNKGYVDFTYFNTLKKLPLYGLNDATPEMVWEYGEKIPRICKNDELHLPEEDTFYILNYYNDVTEIKDFSNDYVLQIIGAINLNTASGKKATDRKIATIYKAIKKNASLGLCST